MNEPVLAVRDLRIAFATAAGPVEAVRGVSFDVAAREVLGIVGESGSGKSLTALALVGLLPPYAQARGDVRLAGVETIAADEETLRRLRGRDVGFVFQDPATTLNPVLRVGAQIVEGEVEERRLSAAAAPARAAALLREVEIADPQTRATQFPHQFSGGMRQRAVIAMAMAGRPKLIVADEPTTALDVTVQAQVLDLLARRQRDSGAAAILITHDLGVVAEVAHRVAIMYAGRIVETGPVAALFAAPRHPYTTALLDSAPRLDGDQTRLDPIPGQPPSPAALPSGCPFHPRCARARCRALCRDEEPPLRILDEGRAVACHFADEDAARLPAAGANGRKAAGAPLLVVENLEVAFPLSSKWLRRRIGAVRAVAGVDLALAAGETLSLVGESGCGKTTTARALIGLVKPTAGRIRFDGAEAQALSSRAARALRRQAQYVFQDPYSSLNPVKTAGDIVAEPLRIHGLFEAMGGARYVARLFEMVGLSPAMAGRLPRDFSGGQKQRIGIARALALKPRLLILDEPVAALDVSIQAQIVNLLQDLQTELGVAYLFIAHDLSVVRHISDRVAVMYLGRIVEEGARDDLFAHPAHPYTQALLSAAPRARAQGRRARIVLQGEIPSPAAPPSGCAFHPRCFRADARCAAERPRLETRAGIATRVACHHAGPPTQREAMRAAAVGA